MSPILPIVVSAYCYEMLVSLGPFGRPRKLDEG